MNIGTRLADPGKGNTFPKILEHNYQTYGDKRRAMRHKRHGIWQSLTWKEYYLNVKYLALGLLCLGFSDGDKLLILGNNAPQWYFAELAAQSNHGAAVGVHPDLTPAEIKFISENCDAKFAIVEDQEQVDKLVEIKAEMPLLREVIHWNYKGLSRYDDPVLKGYRHILQLGEEYEQEHPGLYEKNVETGKADDVCAIVYTSGTTDNVPKGVVHTFQSMRAGAEDLLQVDQWYAHDNAVPLLPPASMMDQCFGIACHLLSTCTLNFTEGPECHQRDTREIQPSIAIYGARYWESQAAMVQARILGSDTVKRFVFRSLMPIGNQAADLRNRKQAPGVFRRLLYGCADAVLFRPIKASLGLSNARICYSSGATLSPDAVRFYHALNLPLKNLYGTAEGGVLTCPDDDDIHLETVGTVHRGAELKITDQGELVYRHPGVFAGYYKDPLKTAQVLQDGWVYSGDSGFVREDGHLVLADRLRDIVQLACGDHLNPQLIESQLRLSAFIKDAWVLAGPAGAFAAAIIVVDYRNVSRWAGQRKVAHTSFADLSQKPEVYELVKQSVRKVNSTLPPGLRLRRFVNLHQEFDPDEGELTRSRNLRRRFLEERYRDLIEGIYADKNEAPIDARVRHRDGRVSTTRAVLAIANVEGNTL